MNSRISMKIFRGSATILILGSSFSCPVMAQFGPVQETGSHILVKTRPVDPERRGDVIRHVGQCMYRVGHSSIERFLTNSDPMSIDYSAIKMSQDNIVRKFGIEDCLTEEIQLTDKAFVLSFSPIQVRAMLMEQDYLALNKGAPTVRTTPLPPRIFVTTGNELVRAQVIGDFADCLVAKDPPGADAIVRTNPTTKAEKAAARALAPALGACVVAGQQINFTPTSVRTMAVEGLWRRYVQKSEVGRSR